MEEMGGVAIEVWLILALLWSLLLHLCYLQCQSGGGPSSGMRVTEPVTKVCGPWIHPQDGNLGAFCPRPVVMFQCVHPSLVGTCLVSSAV